MNLGILVVFKYTNFLVYIMDGVFGRAGITIKIPAFDIVLPVGISFYTFQALGYSIDVYRGKIEPEKSLINYALFVSFFPQLVAGPIERSGNLIKQLSRPHKFDYDNFRDGLLMMLWGYFLKIVIADRAAIFVDTIYGYSTAYTGYYLIVATILFAVQIYCDFAGYSTIAIGSAKMIGINLMENFDAPYFSTSVSEFWRKWHISLTSWFRDYLYIPLGGNRKGTLRKYFNIVFVFLMSGLWHGAAFSFIIWGGLNGIYQVIGDIIKPIRNRVVDALAIKEDSAIFNFFKGLVTFLLVDFAWVFFRASSAREALYIVKSIVTANNPNVLVDKSLCYCGLDESNLLFLIFAIFILAIVDWCKHKDIRLREVILSQCWIIRSLVVAFAIVFILVFGIWGPGYNDANFIYFQF
ncbi:MBOAT family O-acyltransferase [Butyrivibrio sp. XBB1001]|uniref:MBOAT family O-acyltransferase n=1 Tax=Butyrivibrio sp. XBB1001 TaxID=1280682 RepID=UPI002100F77A|nr:MBOAT family O-acyltransferase [Butyrivibrio sp. XBB1001]